MVRKLKLLFLHGYRQNPASFREKSGGFRKLCKKYISEHKILEAPCVIQTTDSGDLRTPEENEKLNERGWWFSRKDGFYKSTHKSEFCTGLEDSLALVKTELKSAVESGEPYDGVIGFSQGACLLSIICHKKEYENDDFPFTFSMFFSGFKSAGLDHSKYYEKQLSFPSFHSVGEGDLVVTCDRGVELAGLYEDCVLMKHEGGHFMPSKGAYRKFYHDFLDKFAKDG